MAVELSRLRRGEWVVGAASAVLLASTFLLKWYGLKAAFQQTGAELGQAVTVNGWHALTDVRWVILITGLVGLGVWFTQAGRRAPALPVSLTGIEFVLSVITSLLLIHRVLISEPGPSSLISQRAGAFVGMFSAIAIAVGCYMSLRQDGIRIADGPGEIETIRIAQRQAGTGGAA